MLKYFLVLSAIYSSGLLAEQTLPQWEAGIWFGGISIPDYRGSNERQEYALPLPYFIYRSERFQFSRQGVKGLLYQGENVHIDVGGKVNLPVDSDKNAARTGMSDLDVALSIGPTMHYQVYKKEHSSLSLQLPLRAALSTDIRHTAYRGFTLSPAIVLRQQAQWNSAVSLAFLFSTRPYNEYYYDVSDNDVRLGRARYQADSGYGGIRLSLITRRTFKKYSLGGFARYDNLRGATYEESPLVTQVNNVTVGLYMTYQFKKSRQFIRFLPDDLDE